MDHITKNDKDRLVSKLISNTHLTTKCVESCRNEIEEQAEFLKFHENIATGENVVNSECHCSEVSTARAKLDKINSKLIKFIS